MLLTTPLARGLFQRAAMQFSGGLVRPSLAAAETAGVAFAERAGIRNDGSDALDRLRKLPATQIARDLHAGQRGDFVGAVPDGEVLTGTLADVVAAGRQAKVPLIIGATARDNTTNLTAGSVDEALTTAFAPVADRARAAYAGFTDPARELREMGRDLTFNENSRFVATRLRAQGLPAYVYRFNYVEDRMRGEWADGPPHSTDVPYSLGTVKERYNAKLTATDAEVSRQMHGYWVNFAITGNPNGPGLPHWPAFDPATNVILSFNGDGSVADAARRCIGQPPLRL